MRKQEWEEVCERISALWPGRRKIPEATVEAWYDELGKRAPADITALALTRLAAESDKAPGIAAIREAVRQLGGLKPHRKEDEPESAEDRERWNRIGADWIFITKCMTPELWAMRRDLEKNDIDPTDLRMILLEEIRERGLEPRPMVALPAERGGDLTPIGSFVGGAVAP